MLSVLKCIYPDSPLFQCQCYFFPTRYRGLPGAENSTCSGVLLSLCVLPEPTFQYYQPSPAIGDEYFFKHYHRGPLIFTFCIKLVTHHLKPFIFFLESIIGAQQYNPLLLSLSLVCMLPFPMQKLLPSQEPCISFHLHLFSIHHR